MLLGANRTARPTSLPFSAMRRPRIVSRVSLGLVLLLALAACSAQEPEVVINEQVPAAQQVADHSDDEEGGEEESLEPDYVFVSEQLAYTEVPTEIPSGESIMGLEIIGGLPHNVVIEGFEGDRVLVEGPGEGSFAAPVNIPPGTYTYYCSIAGHRAAGMEGTITVV